MVSEPQALFGTPRSLESLGGQDLSYGPNMVERIRDFKAEIWDLEGILVRERGCVRIGD